MTDEGEPILTTEGTTDHGVAPAAGPASHPPRVVVLGLGYVGLGLAVRAAQVGFDVVGFDTDEARVAALGTRREAGAGRAGTAGSPATGRFRPSAREADVAGFDVAIIAVPLPLDDGGPRAAHVEAAASLVSDHLRPGATVVLESTCSPGTTEEVVAPALEAGSGLVAGPDFHLGYSPERVDPGNVGWDLRTIPKLVSGIDDASLEAVQRFYDRLVETTVPVRSLREAEMAKLLENTFRQVNIALINELAVVAHGAGIDIWAVIAAAATKPFAFMPFVPGPGAGGTCLTGAADLLSWWADHRAGARPTVIEAASAVDTGMAATWSTGWWRPWGGEGGPPLDLRCWCSG
jgi:UDP-N-acetyl-D-glucosamine dehydrogenase